VADDRHLADDVTRTEPGDLLLALPHRDLAVDDQVGLVGRGLLPDQRPVGGQPDVAPLVDDSLELVVAQVLEPVQLLELFRLRRVGQPLRA